MRALVAGAAGFLGSHLCERLLLDGYEVTAVDNLFTGSMDNLKGLSRSENFSFVNFDICNPLIDSHYPEFEKNFDYIFNLACPASPVHYQKDAIYTTKTSVLGSLHLLDFAKHNNAVIIQASTSEIYGDPLEHPQVERYFGNVNPIGIRSCYDEGKRCAESLFFDFNRQYGTRIKVARIFNTYGPRMAIDDGRVVSEFIASALEGKPIKIFGDGSQTRSFCYVDDLIQGLVSLSKSESSFLGPVNLGNPIERTVGELAEKIISLTNSESKIVYEKIPSDDPKRRKPDISLAYEMLNWSPGVDIDMGLEKTINYFRGVLKI
jgi:UDP-glucuronate decarboxylase